MSKYEVDAAEWAYLQQAHAKANARAANARRNAALSSERIRQGVRLAIGHLPVRVALAREHMTSRVLNWIRIDIEGPKSFGLRRVPDRRIVRRVLDEMIEERRQVDGQNESLCLGECASPLESCAESRDARRTDTQGA